MSATSTVGAAVHAGADRSPARDATVIFLHLPRTAGTTLNSIIRRQYEPESIYTIGGAGVQDTIERFNALSPGERARFAVVRGHVPFGVHELIGGPSTYVTIVRDPVERVISYYYYIRRQTNHHLHGLIASRKMSLKDCLTEGISNQFDNGQARLLAGPEATRAVSYGQASGGMLEAAIDNLRQRFAVVGLTERFDETVLLLQRKLLWGAPLYVRRNVTEGRPARASVDDATLEMVEAYNRLDIELYEVARSAFERSAAAEGEAFARDLKAFRLFNHRPAT